MNGNTKTVEAFSTRAKLGDVAPSHVEAQQDTIEVAQEVCDQRQSAAETGDSSAVPDIRRSVPVRPEHQGDHANLHLRS